MAGALVIVLVVWVGLCGTAFSRNTAGPAESIVVGLTPYDPPFVRTNASGQPIGFTVDLLRQVGGVVGLAPSFKTGRWPELGDALRDGQLDVLAFVGINSDTNQTLGFTIPVAVTVGALFVRDHPAPFLREEADLADLHIATMQDDLPQEIAAKRLWGTALERFPSYTRAFQCLADGPCDAVLAPRLVGLTILEDMSLEGTVREADLLLENFRLEYAMAVRDGDLRMLSQLNGGLALLMAEGKIDQLYQKWLPSSGPGTAVKGPTAPLLIAATGLGLLLLVVIGLVAHRDRALRQERERRRRADAEAAAIVRMLPDTMVRLDKDGRYVDVHDPGGMASAPFAVSKGRLIEEVLPPELAVQVRQAMDRLSKTGEMQSLDYKISKPGEDTRWLQARMAPFEDGGSLALIRDVTDAYRHADQLTRAAAAIASASATKSRFLATMSHELRTPLNAILGFAQLMDAEVAGPLGTDTYKGYVRDIQAAGQSLLSLVSSIMEIAQIEAGRTTLTETEVDLGAVLSKHVALAKAEALERHTQVFLDLPNHPVLVRADASFVQRMIEHLIANAVKFSPGGSVHVSASRREDGGLEVRVTDTGVGMTPEQLVHLGEPFYQASAHIARTMGGFGLGVTLTREMIALHGGSLRYESQPANGTTVHLVFPASRVLSELKLSQSLRVVHQRP